MELRKICDVFLSYYLDIGAEKAGMEALKSAEKAFMDYVGNARKRFRDTRRLRAFNGEIERISRRWGMGDAVPLIKFLLLKSKHPVRNNLLLKQGKSGSYFLRGKLDQLNRLNNSFRHIRELIKREELNGIRKTQVDGLENASTLREKARVFREFRPLLLKTVVAGRRVGRQGITMPPSKSTARRVKRRTTK